MRVVAYWPKHTLRWSLHKEGGEPDMAPSWDAKERPVFWVLATKEEAGEHIAPHMVNEAIYWKSLLKLDPEVLKDVWLWEETGEFSFFVPWIPRLTDAPTVFRKDFPYTSQNSFPAWSIGPQEEPHTLVTQGIMIPDITHETLADAKDLLEKTGSWQPEMK